MVKFQVAGSLHACSDPGQMAAGGTEAEFQFLAQELNLDSLGNFPGGSDGKESACNAGDLGSIPGQRRSPGGGHDKPLQYSCLEYPTDRGVWQATVHRVTQNQTPLKQFSMYTCRLIKRQIQKGSFKIISSSSLLIGLSQKTRNIDYTYFF